MANMSKGKAAFQSSRESSRSHPGMSHPESSQSHPAPPAGLARAPAVISDLFLLSSGSPSSLPEGRGMRGIQQSAREESSGSSGMTRDESWDDGRDEVRFACAAWPRLIRSSSRPLGGGAAERGACGEVEVVS